jgi:hypothetical protein
MRRGLHNGPEEREQRDGQDMQELDSRVSLNDPESAGLPIAPFRLITYGFSSRMVKRMLPIRLVSFTCSPT